MENKIGILGRIAEIYKSGGNIIQFLKGLNNQIKNNLDDILISYDFQAGTYIAQAEENTDFINHYTKLIAHEFENLNINYDSIIEVGVGEATTLVNVINQLHFPIKKALGFDISWSRIHYGNKYLKQKNVDNVILFTADLFNIPLTDNSIEIVYTSHSLEPNGGKEKQALEELYRIANKYIILLEPAYELANDESKRRMDSHGYVKNLVGIAKQLGYKIIENRLFELSSNPINPTQIIIIEKENKENKEGIKIEFYCPITNTPLEKGEGYYYTNTGLLAYPIIKNIPCLLPQNAIVATHLNDF